MARRRTGNGAEWPALPEGKTVCLPGEGLCRCTGARRGRVLAPPGADLTELRQQPGQLLRGALGLLYPPRCPFCGRITGPEAECAACAQELRSLERPVKRLDPLLHYFGALEGAAAVYRYQGGARQAVLRMKYRGEAWHGARLGNCMAERLFGCTFSRRYGILYPERNPAAALEYDLIVPVPASDRRRGYNVPQLLAGPLCRGLGLPLLPQGLERLRFERNQAGLPLPDRLENVAGAFGAAPKTARLLQGRRILLVDDVITTGATAAACAQALLAAGAESVFAVALCVSEPEETGRADAHMDAQRQRANVK